jgi:hypothetical protein
MVARITPIHTKADENTLCGTQSTPNTSTGTNWRMVEGKIVGDGDTSYVDKYKAEYGPKERTVAP